MTMKKRLVSGLQPSGNLHIGNYLGAVKQFVALQEEYEPFVFIADLHAITVPQEPEELRKKTLEIAKIYLAAGLDPEKCILFVQSQVPEHAELMWILNTIARMGDLDKMTQFKDKSKISDAENLSIEAQDIIVEIDKEIKANKITDHKGGLRALAASAEKSTALYQKRELVSLLLQNSNNIKVNNYQTSSVGLFDYPVLQAADILLYDAEIVPVGEDQRQHIELTRTLARRFHDRFGETFVVPEAKIQKESAKIMALDEPTKKMSKSAKSLYNAVALTDDESTVTKKIMKAVTDSGSEITYSDEKPALKNLLTIFSLLTERKPEEIAKEYEGQGYGKFKGDLANVVNAFLKDFQEKLGSISDEEALKILEVGREKASRVAKEKILEVRKRVGLL